MKKYVLAIVAVVIAAVLLAGCADIDLPDWVPGTPESELILSQTENTHSHYARDHFFAINSGSEISKLDKILVRINSDSDITCKVRDTRYMEAGYYKVIASKTISAPNNPNAEWVTFQFDSVDLDYNVVYHMTFTANDDQITMRGGSVSLCYMIYGWP